jgi:hypothetical protein
MRRSDATKARARRRSRRRVPAGERNLPPDVLWCQISTRAAKQ